MENNLAVVKPSSGPLRISEVGDEGIKEALRYAMNLIGVPEKAIPVGPAKDALIDFVKTFHPSLRIADIRQAFGMAANGDLGIDTQLYDKPFNAEFFGRVISEWKKHKAKVNMQPKPLTTTVEVKAITAPKRTPEASFKAVCEFVEREKKIPVTWDWNNVFTHLEASGLIADTNEEKQMFMEAQRQELQTMINTYEAVRNVQMARVYRDILQGRMTLKNHCRKQRCIVWLKAKYGI